MRFSFLLFQSWDFIVKSCQFDETFPAPIDKDCEEK